MADLDAEAVVTHLRVPIHVIHMGHEVTYWTQEIALINRNGQPITVGQQKMIFLLSSGIPSEMRNNPERCRLFLRMANSGVKGIHQLIDSTNLDNHSYDLAQRDASLLLADAVSDIPSQGIQAFGVKMK